MERLVVLNSFMSDVAMSGVRAHVGARVCCDLRVRAHV